MEEKAHSLTHSDEAVYRTAPATPGLLNIRTSNPLELGSCNLERIFMPNHVSCVMCHVSHVTCHMSLFFLLFFGKSGDAYWWRVCYKRGLPHLVFIPEDQSNEQLNSQDNQ